MFTIGFPSQTCYIVLKVVSECYPTEQYYSRATDYELFTERQ